MVFSVCAQQPQVPTNHQRCGELSSGVQSHCPTVQEGSVYNKWDKQDPGLSLGPSAAALMFLREKKQQMCSIPQQAVSLLTLNPSKWEK